MTRAAVLASVLVMFLVVVYLLVTFPYAMQSWIVPDMGWWFR